MRRNETPALSSEIWKINLIISATSTVIALAFVVLIDDLEVFGGRIVLSLAVRILVGLALIVFTMITSRHVINRMCASLRSLREGTRQIEQGNFKVQVENKDPNSEVGALISSFNHMARELDGIELLRQDFISSVSHEFKTPISSIAGFAERLRDESLPPEKREEYTDIIIRESRRLSTLASNTLLLARYENQDIVTEREEYSLDEQLRLCLLSMQEAWTEKELEVDVELEPTTIYGNGDMLAQVWNNLLSNAIKFTPRGGRIGMRCETVEGETRVTVEDNGAGMDEETVRHIFDKFYQGDRSHRLEGNGLGLAIAGRIVSLCGGRIAVDSAPGQGSRFTVILPREARGTQSERRK